MAIPIAQYFFNKGELLLPPPVHVAIPIAQYFFNKGELLLHPPVHVLMFLFPFCLPL